MATYRDAGVDLAAAERLVGRIAPVVEGTWGDHVVGEVGGFAAGLTIPAGYAEPVLMLSTDGVGTKAEVARVTEQFSGLGHDLVAMCVDDLAAAGALPLAISDYIAVGSLDGDVVSRLVASIADACKVAGVALLGGETAEHPGVMAPGRFDIAGTALGVVDRGREIDGSEIAPGDKVVGIASPNLRSNGYSLLRATLMEQYGPHDRLPGTTTTVAEALMAPSVIYSPAVQHLLGGIRPHGMAHITGGGLPGNIPRILPAGLAVDLDAGSWERGPVFEAVSGIVEASDSEMYRAFNMGIGFVVITTVDEAAPAQQILERAGHRTWEIGDVVEGNHGVRIEGIA